MSFSLCIFIFELYIMYEVWHVLQKEEFSLILNIILYLLLVIFYSIFGIRNKKNINKKRLEEYL